MDSLADGIAVLEQGPAGTVCVSHSNTFTNNTSTGNLRDGIWVGARGTHSNVINDNVVDDNARNGIALSGPGSGLPGAVENRLHRNSGAGNDLFDGADFNPDCDGNDWQDNTFGTVNQPCVADIAEDTGTIAGVVTDATTTDPIEGATVTAGGQSAMTDAAGAYTIAEVPTGERTVSASAAGYAPASQQVTVAADETTTADFALTPDDAEPPTVVEVWNNTFGNGLFVTWSDPIVHPPAGSVSDYQIFTASDCSGSPLAVGSQAFFSSNVPHDRDVSFDGWSLISEGGTYYLQVAAGTEASADSGAVNDPECVGFVAVLRPQVTGTVTDAGTGNPIADATVTASDQSATTDAQGRYELRGLSSGQHTVTADGASTTTVSDGSYEIADLEPGDYTVTAEADGYESANQTATVSEGATTTVDFALQADQPEPEPTDPQTRRDCMNGGWRDYGFRNQGQCIRYVQTGKDSRP